MIPKPTVIALKAAITGNVTDQAMVQVRNNGRAFGSMGVETGGRIVLGTATTADVTVKDTNGKVLYSATGVVANTTINPIPAGVQGPLLVTIANISNAAHTLTVYWGVKK